jgi:hypothetical protein
MNTKALLCPSIDKETINQNIERENTFGCLSIYNLKEAYACKVVVK